MNTPTIGTFLKEKRKAAGLSQKKVAQTLAISPSLYNHFENEKRIPSLEIIMKFSKLYDINPMDIIYMISTKERYANELFFIRHIKNEKTSFSEKENSLLNMFNTLSNTEQDIVLKMVKSMSNKTDIK